MKNDNDGVYANVYAKSYSSRNGNGNGNGVHANVHAKPRPIRLSQTDRDIADVAKARDIAKNGPAESRELILAMADTIEEYARKLRTISNHVGAAVLDMESGSVSVAAVDLKEIQRLL